MAVAVKATPAVWKLHSCPHCGGDLYTDYYEYWRGWKCLQCGRELEVRCKKWDNPTRKRGTDADTAG